MTLQSKGTNFSHLEIGENNSFFLDDLPRGLANLRNEWSTSPRAGNIVSLTAVSSPSLPDWKSCRDRTACCPGVTTSSLEHRPPFPGTEGPGHCTPDHRRAAVATGVLSDWLPLEPPVFMARRRGGFIPLTDSLSSSENTLLLAGACLGRCLSSSVPVCLRIPDSKTTDLF